MCMGGGLIEVLRLCNKYKSICLMGTNTVWGSILTMASGICWGSRKISLSIAGGNCSKVRVKVQMARGE